ncbi:MAG: rhomboid family intramembrane serine protease [Burkholderiales bacterium]
MIPISDYPSPPGKPFVTIALIVVNVAVYLLVTLPLGTQPANHADPAFQEYLRLVMQSVPRNVSPQQVIDSISAYDLTVFKWGFRPADPSLATLVSSIFLHGGFMHLAGNMLYLWIYGDNVEHRLGPVAFLFWYLVTGMAATLFHALFNLGSPIPLVGASGAISGVLGFYFLWFPHHSVRVFLFLFPIYVGTVMLNARFVLAIYLLWDNVLPFLIAPGGGGVAHGAHIGGFIAGLAAAAWMNARQRGKNA